MPKVKLIVAREGFGNAGEVVVDYPEADAARHADLGLIEVLDAPKSDEPDKADKPKPKK